LCISVLITTMGCSCKVAFHIANIILSMMWCVDFCGINPTVAGHSMDGMADECRRRAARILWNMALNSGVIPIGRNVLRSHS